MNKKKNEVSLFDWESFVGLLFFSLAVFSMIALLISLLFLQSC